MFMRACVADRSNGLEYASPSLQHDNNNNYYYHCNNAIYINTIASPYHMAIYIIKFKPRDGQYNTIQTFWCSINFQSL